MSAKNKSRGSARFHGSYQRPWRRFHATAPGMKGDRVREVHSTVQLDWVASNSRTILLSQ